MAGDGSALTYERKHEAVLTANRTKRSTFSIRAGGHMIASESVIKYLGMMTDTKINFKGHLAYACEK